MSHKMAAARAGACQLPISTTFLEVAGELQDGYDMALLLVTGIWITITSYAIANAFSLHACIGPIHDSNLIIWALSLIHI